jgi:hypothetical protein
MLRIFSGHFAYCKKDGAGYAPAKGGFKMFLRLAVLSGLALFSFPAAHADGVDSGTDIQMVQVASSYPSGYTGKIMASVDPSGSGLSSFHFTDSRNSSLDFTVDQLKSGVVLVRALGKDILKISGPDFTSDGGGMMILTFLRNFLGSDRREVHFDYLRRGSATDWVLQTDDSEGRDSFDALSIIVSKTLGLPTGVGDITLSSSDRTVRRYDPNHLPAGSIMLDGLDSILSY